MSKYCLNCMSELNSSGVCPACENNEQVVQAVHYLKAGTVLNNKYIVGKVLGEGGFGITYIGRDTMLDIKIAIKEYFPNGYVNRNHEASSEITTTTPKQKEFFDKGKEKFILEARSIAKFNDEKGVVDVRDYFEENGTAYIIMEYLEGKTLSEYIKENGNMDASLLFEKMQPIMESLEKMHTKGVIHRDITPDNIMYMNNGKLKLMDFGSARYFANEEKQMSVMLKQGYAPEEQYRKNGNQGPWTDVYSMCATIYKCITGVVPEDALDRLHEDNLKAPSQIGVKINKSLEIVLMHGLAVHYEDRCKNMTELLEMTDKALKGIVLSQNVNSVTQNDMYKTQAADEIDYKTQMADGEYDDALKSAVYADKFSNNNGGYIPPSNNGGNNKNSSKALIAIIIATVVFLVIAVFALFGIVLANDNNDAPDPFVIETTATGETEETEKETEKETEEDKTVIVPDVVDLKKSSAEDALKSAGLKTKVIRQDSSSVEYDYVMSQSPAPSSELEKGDTVTLYVSDTYQYSDVYYCSAEDYLSLRAEPSRSSSRLAKINYNDRVGKLSSNGEFWYVEYRGQKGYVLGEFLSKTPYPTPDPRDDTISSSSSKVSAPAYTDVYYCCATEWVTLRDRPDPSGKELDKVYCREAVYVMETSGKYYYVEYEGQKGFVMKKFFSTDRNAALIDDEY